ncbi:hypothetical protein EDL98_07550 [Ornithobacterium rhinotracheale]|uniref:hypothetical protein n=1 Tax=Ornithobacterium rhinotracheale TaxID=28251 RepID=UPI00129CEA5F|nr:hypothetical protein [Ornithobacterium rhinotracheale]MRJ07802.1 hypothetical protein [Ornithobacterium rhinotracheale]MRJ10938.1 hypothetical protein [Ornithobacterium rhinotracheale]UOH78681.1 hypothetical protein MT996_04225 [Ornithobacterium rhinotracheale]
MDFQDILLPIPQELKDYAQMMSKYMIGSHVRFELDEDFGEHAIVLLSIAEYDSFGNRDADPFFSEVRRKFYQLSISNWKTPFYDLGSVAVSEHFIDTCADVEDIVRQFSEHKVSLILLGGTQALSYPVYKGINKKWVNVACIDYKLDIDAANGKLTHDNFITHMILGDEQKLLEYNNIANQAPYNAAEEFDVLEQLNFESLRLGKLTEDLSQAEPLLREKDLLSVDFSAVQSSSFNAPLVHTANGLNEREICGLMRYAGLSPTIKNVHLSNSYLLDLADASLASEMLWYFMDAKNNMKNDSEKEKFRVLYDDGEVVFYKSVNSERWWIEVTIDEVKKMLPCSEADYRATLDGNLPEKWFKFYKRFY